MQVDYFDCIEQAVSILADSRLTEDFMTQPGVQYVNEDRVYGEMNTGAFWEGAQEKAPRVIIKMITFCIVFFTVIFFTVRVRSSFPLTSTWTARG